MNLKTTPEDRQKWLKFHPIMEEGAAINCLIHDLEAVIAEVEGIAKRLRFEVLDNAVDGRLDVISTNALRRIVLDVEALAERSAAE